MTSGCREKGAPSRGRAATSSTSWPTRVLSWHKERSLGDGSGSGDERGGGGVRGGWG